MFEREKLSCSNFNDWFCLPKVVLRVEKKPFVIEQPIPLAHAVDSEAQVLAEWNAVYDSHNEVACLMFGKKRRLVSSYVLKMKGYVEQLERLGYVLPQDLSIGLIMNSITSDFSGFIRNYNMHNIGKTISELHALLVEYEKGLPKKAATPQVMAIQDGRIQKANKKSLNAKGKGKGKGKGKARERKGKGKGKDNSYIPKRKTPKTSTKEHPTKDDACHYYKEVGHWKRNYPAYLVELIKKKKKVGTGLRGVRKLKQVLRGVVSVSRLVDNGFIQCFTDYRISVSKNDVLYFNDIPCNGIYEIDMLNLVVNVNSIYNVSNKRVKYKLDSTYMWHCRLAHISKKRIEKLQHNGILKSTDEESFVNACVVYRVSKNEVENQLGNIIKALQSDRGGKYISQGFKDYLKACGIVQQLTPPYTPQHNRVSERRNQSATRILTMVWGCEALVKRDTPNKLQQRSIKCIFIGYPKEMMGYYFYFPPENKIVVARSARTHQVPDHLCLNLEVEEHNLGDLNKPANYKAAILDPKSEKWLDAMNAEIQSIKDNQVWCLVDLPPNVDCMMVMKEIKNGLLEEVEKFGWWFEQDIDNEREEVEENEEDEDGGECMRTRFQSRNSNRQQQQVPPTFVEPSNLVEPIENQAPPVVTMADNRIMAQLLEAPTEGYEDAIVIPEITADNFELKHGLLTLVQNKKNWT
ncbi:NIN-like protein [Tanacetum coccineum]